jgi:hypothetical protein
MKLSSRIEQLRRQKLANQPRQPKPQPVHRERPRWTRKHWLWAGLWLLLAFGGAWAVLELAVWNKLPPELVGTWQVREGPMAGGSFHFSRFGTVQIHVTTQGKSNTLHGRVAVEGKTLRITSQNARSQQDETRDSVIQELTANTLVLELESGEVLKMARRP